MRNEKEKPLQLGHLLISKGLLWVKPLKILFDEAV